MAPLSAMSRYPAATPANTTTDRHRLTLRARLGVDVKLSDGTQVGPRLSTGSATAGPNSSSQTLGNQFNKFSITLDRAFLRWEPRQDLRLFAGRMANPFFSTDLTWPEDVSFDGLAGQAEQTLASGLYVFAHAGGFALEEFNLERRDKWLFGLQVGADWAITAQTGLRVGLAVYDFRHVEGVRESAPKPTGAADGTRIPRQARTPAAARRCGSARLHHRG